MAAPTWTLMTVARRYSKPGRGYTLEVLSTGYHAHVITRAIRDKFRLAEDAPLVLLRTGSSVPLHPTEWVLPSDAIEFMIGVRGAVLQTIAPVKVADSAEPPADAGQSDPQTPIQVLPFCAHAHVYLEVVRTRRGVVAVFAVLNGSRLRRRGIRYHWYDGCPPLADAECDAVARVCDWCATTGVTKLTLHVCSGAIRACCSRRDAVTVEHHGLFEPHLVQLRRAGATELRTRQNVCNMA